MAKNKLSTLMELTADIVPEREKETVSLKIRSAPGQMMGLSAQRDDALNRAEKAELEAEIAKAELNKVLISGEIPIDLLHEVDGRRRLLSHEEYENLRENLRTNELVQAITVKPRPSGGYEIISGHNRVAAYRELGKHTILAVIDHKSDDTQSELNAFYANLLQPSLPDFEKYLGFKNRQNKTKKTQKELAIEAGLSEQFISDIFSFDKLPEESKRILSLNPHVLGASAAAKLVIAGSDGKEKQVIEAIKMLVGETPLTQQQAIAFVTGKSLTEVKKAPPVIIKDSRDARKPFCQIQTRSGTVNIKFRDEKVAEDWLNKFEKFIRHEIKNGK